MTRPLFRNRDYQLLWTGQALSEVGISATTIALPLLVLAFTGSPGLSGLVLGVDAAAQLVAGLPAGALVDRWDRRKMMLCCEAVQAVAIGSVVLALWWDAPSIPHLMAVAVATGVCTALFEPAEEASLPRLVTDQQLPTALALNSARSSIAQLSGTALGGLLFALRNWFPFGLQALTHVASFGLLLFIRIPGRREQPASRSSLRTDIAEGLRWMWRHRLVRVVAFCAVGLNLFFQAFYIVIIALAQQRGVPSGEIGIMAAMFGAGGILGALAAPRLHRVLGPYRSIIGVFWTLALLSPLAVFTHNGYLLGAVFAAMAFLAPTANITINTYQLLLAPDELRGRVSSVMNVVLGVAAVAGPALGGLLMELLPGGRTILLISACIGVLTVLATVSPSLRSFPHHEEIDEPERMHADD
ncbi:MFS transporter [Lentzea tibetensis]|uniref:MFS transporter n=1 Tax=Lentzea tibetensis TaxID=2591470 RepID=A0A563F311_9PSEU|nr:MFS transporter [Lentzea tibetensis]TWP54345.1 MFS transporter [Lentzea tibetensis]